ncbi:MAG: 50S ribosomal protein L21 [Candidatus Melainabacteria bacterium]|jgi:large subunit ribosomal protein L21
MFAYIKHSGKQFKVTEGLTIIVDKLEAEEGSQLTISDIPLAVKDDNSILVNPKGEVVLEVASQFKGKKVLILKQRPKKGYRRKQGHRQDYTKLIVKKISV